MHVLGDLLRDVHARCGPICRYAMLHDPGEPASQSREAAQE